MEYARLALCTCLLATACRNTSVEKWPVQATKPARITVPVSAASALAILEAEFDFFSTIVACAWRYDTITDNSADEREPHRASIRLKHQNPGTEKHWYLSLVYHRDQQPLPYIVDLEVIVTATSATSSAIEVRAIRPQVLAGSTPHPFHGTMGIFPDVPAVGIAEWTVLRACGEALGIKVPARRLPQPGIGAVRALLSSPDESLRKKAMYTVGVLRDEGAIPALARALAANDSFSRYAAECLGEIGTGAVVPPLVNGLRSMQPDMQRVCVQALRRVGPDAKDAVDDLLRYWTAHRNSWDIVFALASIAPADPRVLEAFETSSRLPAAIALYAAGRIDEAELIRRGREKPHSDRTVSLLLARCPELPTNFLTAMTLPKPPPRKSSSNAFQTWEVRSRQTDWEESQRTLAAIRARARDGVRPIR